jgi:hypothetical protein
MICSSCQQKLIQTDLNKKTIWGFNPYSYNTFHDLKNSFRDLINNIEFDPQYSYYTKEEINQINLKIKAGWLMSCTEKGLMSLFNAREKRYFRILVKDLKIPIDDIMYKDDIMFKIK